jgi:polyferredoxin
MGILGLIVLALFTSLVLRTPFKVDVVRDRATLARIVSGGKIENVYRLQIMNATELAGQYQLSVHGLPGLVLASEPVVGVDATQSRWVPVTVQLPFDAASAGSHAIQFEIEAVNASGHVTEKSVFLVPR